MSVVVDVGTRFIFADQASSVDLARLEDYIGFTITRTLPSSPSLLIVSWHPPGLGEVGSSETAIPLDAVLGLMEEDLLWVVSGNPKWEYDDLGGETYMVGMIKIGSVYEIRHGYAWYLGDGTPDDGLGVSPTLDEAKFDLVTRYEEVKKR